MLCASLKFLVQLAVRIRRDVMIESQVLDVQEEYT